MSTELEKFEVWWERYGQYCRAGGGGYERTFAYAAWLAATTAQPAAAVPSTDHRDADWAMAMTLALGPGNGLSIPTDPDVAEFRRFFAAVRLAPDVSVPSEPRTLRDGRPMPTSDAGWLHLLDMERNEWYMRGKEHSDQAQASQAAEIAEFIQQQPKDEK